MNWALKDLKSGKITHVTKVCMKVGRHSNADIPSTSSVVSRDHAEFLVLGDGSICIEDHQSSNGTYVNNELIKPRTRITLRNNDVVGFGCCSEAAKDKDESLDFLLLQVMTARYEVIVIEDTPPPSPNIFQQGAEENGGLTDSEEIIEIDDNDDDVEVAEIEDVKPPIQDIHSPGPSGIRKDNTPDSSEKSSVSEKVASSRVVDEEIQEVNKICDGPNASSNTPKNNTVDSSKQSESISVRITEQINEIQADKEIQDVKPSLDNIEHNMSPNSTETKSIEGLVESAIPEEAMVIQKAQNVLGTGSVEKAQKEQDAHEVEDVKPNIANIKCEATNSVDIISTIENTASSSCETAIKKEVKQEPDIASDVEAQASLFKEPTVPVKKEPVDLDYSIVDDYIVVEDDDEPFACSQLVSMCKIEKTESDMDPVIRTLEELNYKDELQRDSPLLVELDNYYEDERDLLNQLLTQEFNDTAEEISDKQENTAELREKNLEEYIDNCNFDEDDDVFMEIDEDELLKGDHSDDGSQENKTDLKPVSSRKIIQEENKESKTGGESSKEITSKKGQSEESKTDREEELLAEDREDKEQSDRNEGDEIEIDVTEKDQIDKIKKDALGKECRVIIARDMTKDFKYVKPPIIEPHFMKPRNKIGEKRRSSDQSSAESNKKLKLSPKRPELVPKENKRKCYGTNRDKNRFVIDPKEKREIKKNRTERLKELCNKSKRHDKTNRTNQRVEVKVKTSEGRGLFLLEEPSTSKHVPSKGVTVPKKLSFNNLPSLDATGHIQAKKAPLSKQGEKKRTNLIKNEVPAPTNLAKNRNNEVNTGVNIDKQAQVNTIASNFLKNVNNEVNVGRTNTNTNNLASTNGPSNDIPGPSRVRRDPRDLPRLPQENRSRVLPAEHRPRYELLPLNFNHSPMSSPEYNDNISANIAASEELKRLTEVLCNTVYSSSILKRITRWRHKWLQEQNNISKSPPVCDYPLEEVPDKFNCYADYVKIMSGAALLEIWKSAYDNWVKICSTSTVLKAKVIHQRAVKELSYMDCEATGDDITRDLFKENYLILAETVLKQGNTKILHAYFSFVKYSKFSLKKDPVTGKNITHLSFTVALKLDGNVLSCDEIQCKPVSNIAYYVGLMKNLKALEKSPLMQRILQPTCEKFTNTFTDIHLEDVGAVRYLNSVQRTIVKEAVQVCMQNEPGMYLIQGPPGTGKTTVIVNIILQIMLGHRAQKPRILLTAPSNAAVDCLILKLHEERKKLSDELRKQIKIVRVGVYNSVHQDVQPFHLKDLTKRDCMSQLFSQNTSLRAHHDSLNRHIKQLTERYNRLLYKEEDTTEIEEELKRARERIETENFLRKHIPDYSYFYGTTENKMLSGCTVLCATLNSCIQWQIENAIKRSTKEQPFYFTCCIMDEATQCTELEALTPLQLGIKKFVLVGDPQQLPATVQNMEAKKLNYGKSLFTRISNNFANSNTSPVKMLTVQYRMHEEIVRFPNKKFYERRLTTRYSVKNKIVPSITPYLVFNLESKSYVRQYHNSDEINFVKEIIHVLTSTISESCEYSIGVITPYNIQKEAMIENLPTHRLKNVSITVNTVDGFQGQEKDIIIISYVRNMPNSFLQDPQRINVAITRARQALFIVGSYDLFKHCSVLYDLREDAKARSLCRDIVHTQPYFAFMKQDLFRL